MASPTPHSLGANFSLCHYFGLSASPLAALVGLGTPSTTPTPLPAFFTSAFTHSLSRSLYSKDQRKGKKQPALGWMETGCSQGDQGLTLPGSSCTGLGGPRNPQTSHLRLGWGAGIPDSPPPSGQPRLRNVLNLKTDSPSPPEARPQASAVRWGQAGRDLGWARPQRFSQAWSTQLLTPRRDSKSQTPVPVLGKPGT